MKTSMLLFLQRKYVILTIILLTIFIKLHIKLDTKIKRSGKIKPGVNVALTLRFLYSAWYGLKISL